MSKLIFFPNQRKINEDASLWLTRLSRGLDQREDVAFQQWLSESPRHRQTLWKIAVLWDEMDTLGELSKLYPIEEWKPQGRRSYPLGLSIANAAAIVLVFSTIIGVGLHYRSDSVKEFFWGEGKSPIDNTYQTSVGERKTLSLEDGSIVTLNTDSEIKVKYSASARNLQMTKGEAYFNVAKDNQRPFNVAVAGKNVTAIGTAFNIRLKSANKVEVIVSEGIVSLSEAQSTTADSHVSKSVSKQLAKSTTSPISITSGKRVIFDGDEKKIDNIDSQYLMNELAWQRGIIIFQGESLEEVLAEVNRYTSVKIFTKDDSIKNTRIGGFYKTDDINGLLKALKNNFQIQSSVNEDKNIVLYRG